MWQSRRFADPGDIRYTECPWPDCADEPDDEDNMPLCPKHLAVAWRYVNSLGGWTDIEERWRRDAAARRQREHRSAQPAPEESLVYFVRFGDRIKIGYTSNLASRMTVIPHDEILGVVPGTMADEKRCHAAFAHLREHGEWFRAEPDLLQFIAEVAEPAA